MCEVIFELSSGRAVRYDLLQFVRRRTLFGVKARHYAFDVRNREEVVFRAEDVRQMASAIIADGMFLPLNRVFRRVVDEGYSNFGRSNARGYRYGHGVMTFFGGFSHYFERNSMNGTVAMSLKSSINFWGDLGSDIAVKVKANGEVVLDPPNSLAYSYKNISNLKGWTLTTSGLTGPSGIFITNGGIVLRKPVPKKIPRDVVENFKDLLTAGNYNDEIEVKCYSRTGVFTLVREDLSPYESREYVCYGPAFNMSTRDGEERSRAFFIGVIEEDVAKSEAFSLWYDYLMSKPALRACVLNPKGLIHDRFAIRLDAPSLLCKFTAMAIRNGWEYDDAFTFKKLMDSGLEPDDAFLLSVFHYRELYGTKIYEVGQSIYPAFEHVGNFQRFLEGWVSPELTDVPLYGSVSEVCAELCTLFSGGAGCANRSVIDQLCELTDCPLGELQENLLRIKELLEIK